MSRLCFIRVNPRNIRGKGAREIEGDRQTERGGAEGGEDNCSDESRAVALASARRDIDPHLLFSRFFNATHARRVEAVDDRKRTKLVADSP